MRVTNKMLSDSFLTDMKTNLQNMKKIQGQMTSGKEISKPSDDPYKTAKMIKLNRNISMNTEYNTNIKDCGDWLDTTDTALNELGNSMQRIRQLLESSGNAAYGTTERQTIKDEINSKIGEISQILNTTFEGKYVFGGSRVTNKPTCDITDASGNNALSYCDSTGEPMDLYSSTLSTDNLNEFGMLGADSSIRNSLTSVSGIAVNGNSKLNTEISKGVIVNYNVSAGQIMQYEDGNGNACDLSKLLSSITTHLDNKEYSSVDTNVEGAYKDSGVDPSSSLINSDLQGITDAINNVLKLRSQVGAYQNRMDSAKSVNEDENYNMTEILSYTGDIDITEKTMQYATLQTVYLASLQTSSKVIQPTLIEYL